MIEKIFVGVIIMTVIIQLYNSHKKTPSCNFVVKNAQKIEQYSQKLVTITKKMYDFTNYYVYFTLIITQINYIIKI